MRRCALRGLRLLDAIVVAPSANEETEDKIKNATARVGGAPRVRVVRLSATFGFEQFQELRAFFRAIGRSGL